MSCQQEPWGYFPHLPKMIYISSLLFQQISNRCWLCADSFNSGSNLGPNSKICTALSLHFHLLNWQMGYGDDKSEQLFPYSKAILPAKAQLPQQAGSSKQRPRRVRTMIHPPQKRGLFYYFFQWYRFVSIGFHPSTHALPLHNSFPPFVSQIISIIHIGKGRKHGIKDPAHWFSY